MFAKAKNATMGTIGKKVIRFISIDAYMNTLKNFTESKLCISSDSVKSHVSNDVLNDGLEDKAFDKFEITNIHAIISNYGKLLSDLNVIFNNDKTELSRQDSRSIGRVVHAQLTKYPTIQMLYADQFDNIKNKKIIMPTMYSIWHGFFTLLLQLIICVL